MEKAHFPSKNGPKKIKKDVKNQKSGAGGR